MTRLKICIVSQEFPPETGNGGIATQSAMKARGLSERGHDVTVLSMTNADLPHRESYHSATVHRIRLPQMPVPAYGIASQWLTHSAGVAAKLKELTAHQRFDIIHFPEYAGEGFLWQTDTFAYSNDLGMKYAVQMHGPLAMLAETSGWPQPGGTTHQVGCFMEKMAVSHCHLLMASSHNTAAYCASHYGIDPESVHVIHSGVDTNRFAPRERPIGRGTPRILFVGKIVHAKGAEDLIHVVIKLRERFPNILLRLIGPEDEKLANNLRQDIADAGAINNIELLGSVPHSQLPEHLAWCDFFAGPSVFEPGPGNVYLETMSAGRAVIACDSGGTPEVVLDGQTGLLIPPKDSEALTNAIVTLARDPARCKTLGENGRSWVCDSFSEARYLDKVEKAYIELVKHDQTQA